MMTLWPSTAFMGPSSLKHVPVKAYTILEANQQGHLTKVECQEPTGDVIVDKVVKRRTSIYVTEVVDKDSEVGNSLCHVFRYCTLAG